MYVKWETSTNAEMVGCLSMVVIWYGIIRRAITKLQQTDFSKRRKIVRSIIHRRPSFRGEDLPVIPSPLRIVDAVDPVLRLDHYAAVLVHELGTTSRSPVVALHLARLDRYCSILANAAVDLQSLLVGGEIHSDAGRRRPQ
jgi:hypothetical protein